MRRGACHCKKPSNFGKWPYGRLAGCANPCSADERSRAETRKKRRSLPIRENPSPLCCCSFYFAADGMALLGESRKLHHKSTAPSKRAGRWKSATFTKKRKSIFLRCFTVDQIDIITEPGRRQNNCIITFTNHGDGYIRLARYKTFSTEYRRRCHQFKPGALKSPVTHKFYADRFPGK